jgi:hypothetical protein
MKKYRMPKPRRPSIMDSPQEWAMPEMKNSVWSLRRPIGREDGVGVVECGRRGGCEG